MAGEDSGVAQCLTATPIGKEEVMGDYACPSMAEREGTVEAQLTAVQEEIRVLRERLEKAECALDNGKKVADKLFSLGVEYQNLTSEFYIRYSAFFWPAPPTSVPELEPKAKYPCKDCGTLRTTAAGGDTFTVCDECWDKAHSKTPESEDMVMVRREDLPDPDKLLIIADWFENHFPPDKSSGTEVQDDLRKWSRTIKAALSAKVEVKL